MLLKSLRLKNIRSYDDETINFTKGSTLLSGDIGSGKSTVLLAVEFALFGIRRGELEGSALLRHGADAGTVELNFEINSHDILISRKLKRGKSITQESGWLSINGKKEELTPVELKARIMELMGYPKGKNDYIFRYTMYTPQEEMKNILMNKERLETIRKIFNIDKYGRIKGNSKILMQELRSMKRELEAFASDIEKKISEINEKKGLLQDVELKIIEKKNAKKITDDHIIDIKKEIEKYSEFLQHLNELRKDMVKTDTELSSSRSSLAKNERELILVSERLKKNEDELSKIISSGVPNLTYSEVSSRLKMLENDLRDLISKKAVISEDIKKLDSILEKGICSYCGQMIHNLTTFKTNLGIKHHLDNEMQGKIDAINKRAVELKNQEKNIRDYELQNEKRKQMEKNADQMRQDHQKLLKDCETLKSEIQRLEKNLDEIKEKLKAFGTVEEEQKILQERLNQKLYEKIDIEKSLSRDEQQLEDLQRNIKTLEAEIESKKTSKKKIEFILGITNWMDGDFLRLVETIEKHVMAAIQKEFNEFFQRWFGIIMQEENLSVRIDEQFSPVIEQNGFEIEYANLSGGEKTAIALAYRIALNRVINSMIDEIKTKDILILDEPTDGFSSDQVDRIRYVIEELALRQIIIVSHEPKIDTFVDNVVKIWKKDHISKIIN